MSRLPVVVRGADPEDAASLIDIWERCAFADSPLPVTTSSAAPTVAETAEAISEQSADPNRRMYIALIDGRIVGMIALRRESVSPITTTKAIAVSSLRVEPKSRRRFVASTLMSAAVSWAEEVDCEIMTTWSPVGSREANRFLTRLGFGQVATVRAAQVSALRARFAGIATSSKDTGKLIAVRRTMRRRRARGPLSPDATA